MRAILLSFSLFLASHAAWAAPAITFENVTGQDVCITPAQHPEISPEFSLYTPEHPYRLKSGDSYTFHVNKALAQNNASEIYFHAKFKVSPHAPDCGNIDETREGFVFFGIDLPNPNTPVFHGYLNRRLGFELLGNTLRFIDLRAPL